MVNFTKEFTVLLMIAISNITREYIVHAKPESGEIIFQDGYDIENHQKEIEIAGVIWEQFGGSIILLKERNEDHVKTPDYLWRGLLWDLKSPISRGGIDKRTQKGLQQIRPNPGGIILDLSRCDVPFRDVVTIVKERFGRSGLQSIDLIMIRSNAVVEIIQYEKRDRPPANKGQGSTSICL